MLSITAFNVSKTTTVVRSALQLIRWMIAQLCIPQMLVLCCRIFDELARISWTTFFGVYIIEPAFAHDTMSQITKPGFGIAMPKDSLWSSVSARLNSSQQGAIKALVHFSETVPFFEWTGFEDFWRCIANRHAPLVINVLDHIYILLEWEPNFSVRTCKAKPSIFQFFMWLGFHAYRVLKWLRRSFTWV